MDDDYEVGYKKPPKAHQFKKGQSGNPKGRPKGAKNLGTLFFEDAHSKIAIKEGGQTKVVSKLDAIIKSLSVRAIKGDSRSATQYLKLAAEHLPAPEPPPSPAEAVNADDLAVLENCGSFLAEIEAIKAAQEGDDGDR